MSLPHLSPLDLEDTYDCCEAKALVWDATPRISKDWVSYSSVCLNCGVTGHVSESHGRVKTSQYARDFAKALHSMLGG